jgi:hypothetical protein
LLCYTHTHTHTHGLNLGVYIRAVGTDSFCISHSVERPKSLGSLEPSSVRV